MTASNPRFLSLCDKVVLIEWRLPGPAEGVLPGALSSMPEVALKTLNINLAELIFHLRGRDDEFAQIPLAEMVRDAE